MTRQLFLAIVAVGLLVIAYAKGTWYDSNYEEQYATTGIWVLGVFATAAAILDIALALPSWGSE
jgi:hypothetical protein